MNYEIGFSKDNGQVFMRFTLKGPGGQPIQVTPTWSPGDAERIGDEIVRAAKEARKLNSIVVPHIGVA